MDIRKLQEKDAPWMLEWMHDPDVVENLQGKFMEKTMADCLGFIAAAEDASRNLHLAVVNDSDEYMGTVSLKNICGSTAEFAITIRKCAMGKGYSAFAMTRIIQIGLEQRNLSTIYWCVSPENRRAVRFYDKNGYSRMEMPENLPGLAGYTPEQIRKYLWYCVKKSQD